MLITQIYLIDSNVIQSERRKVSESDHRMDSKLIKTIKDQLKAQTADAGAVELYGYASMIDPRTYIQPFQSPVNHQYNNYQQLYDTMKASESAVHQRLPNGFQVQELPQYNVGNDEEALHVIKDYLKKYDMKRYFLKKILGNHKQSSIGFVLIDVFGQEMPTTKKKVMMKASSATNTSEGTVQQEWPPKCSANSLV